MRVRNHLREHHFDSEPDRHSSALTKYLPEDQRLICGPRAVAGPETGPARSSLVYETEFWEGRSPRPRCYGLYLLRCRRPVPEECRRACESRERVLRCKAAWSSANQPTIGLHGLAKELSPGPLAGLPRRERERGFWDGEHLNPQYFLSRWRHPVSPGRNGLRPRLTLPEW